MPDITSTSFGLLIAFLLPGLAGLYSFGFWSARVRRAFDTLWTAQSNVGAFLLVLLCALTVGLLITVVRWIVFECLLCKKHRLTGQDFGKLSTDGKLSSFRALADEHYRYHQFWGGMCVAMPPLFIGLVRDNYTNLGGLELILFAIGFTVLELLTAVAACHAYRNYVDRGKSILGGHN
jgi:hypothetical protein